MPQVFLPAFGMYGDSDEPVYLNPDLAGGIAYEDEENEERVENSDAQEVSRGPPRLQEWIKTGLPSQSTPRSNTPHSQVADLFYEILSSAPEFGPKLLQTAHSWLIDNPSGTNPLDHVGPIDSVLTVVSHEKGIKFINLAEVALELLVKPFLCGYSKEHMEACDPENDNLWIPTWVNLRSILYVLHYSLATLEVIGSGSQSNRNAHFTGLVDRYLQRSPLLWNRLWDLKESILNIRKVPCEGSGIYTCLIHIASSEVSLYLAHSTNTERLEASPLINLMEYIWIHASSVDTRYWAFLQLGRILSELETRSVGVYGRFFATQPDMSQDIVKAGIRDLKNPQTHRLFTHRLIDFLPIARIKAPTAGVSTAMDHKLFKTGLASARTLLCGGGPVRGDERPLMRFDFLNTYFFEVWGGQARRGYAPLSEEDMYSILCLVHVPILHHMTREVSPFRADPTKELDELRQIMLSCCRHLERRSDLLRELTSEQRERLQAVSQIVWTKAVYGLRETLQTVPSSRRSISSSTYHAYVRLGIALRLDPTCTVASVSEVAQIPPRASYGIGKACNWRECQCSAFNIVHQMKECKGCRRVYYCSVRCQAEDWNKGNHKAVCS